MRSNRNFHYLAGQVVEISNDKRNKNFNGNADNGGNCRFE